jgi:hypothetical protein
MPNKTLAFMSNKILGFMCNKTLGFVGTLNEAFFQGVFPVV